MINDMTLKAYCKFKSMMKEERGDIVQTGVIIGILLMVTIAAFAILRPQIIDAFQRIGDGVEGSF